MRVVASITNEKEDSEARARTPEEKFDPEGEVCNAKLSKPEIEPLRRWEVDPSWMTLCHINDHENSFPNLERNWCWVGFKKQCHQTGQGQSWAAVQDSAYQAGRLPPPDQAPFAPVQNPGLCDRPSLGVARKWSDDQWASARKWFRKYVRVYVVNLQADAKRLTKITNRLRELSIDFTRVGGIDMSKADTMEQAVIAGWIPRDFNFSRALVAARKVAVDGGRNLLPGIHRTMGSAAAHFRAQSRVIDDGAALGLILEDAAWVESDFVPRLWSVVSSELPCDWEVLSLSSRCGYGRCVSPHLSRVQPDGNEKDDTCRHGVNLGMLGTLYRARAVGPLQARWQRAVFDDSRADCFDVDVALASMSDSVAYYAVPSSQAPGFLHALEKGHSSQ
jgi:GR25 family glycosyltransferase involved in LPS biosynthesis